MIRRPPRSTRTDTLSLHDALPISSRRSTRATSPAPACLPLSAPASSRTPGRSCSPDGTPATPRSACWRPDEHTSELQSLMRMSYAVFCLKKKILLVPNQTLIHPLTDRLAHNRTTHNHRH